MKALPRCVRCWARPHGEGWSLCESQRAFIERHLGDHVRLSKVAKLLGRKRGTPSSPPAKAEMAGKSARTEGVTRGGMLLTNSGGEGEYF
jgi:hypothetical protein